MFFLKSLLWLFAFHFAEKHYSIKLAKTKEEKEQVFKFRYQIYKVELKLQSVESNVHDDMIYDKYDLMENTLIFYSGDLNNITGTIRIVVWDKNVLPGEIKNKFHIDESVLSHVDVVGISDYFQIKKEYRTSLLALTFISCFSVTRQNLATMPDIAFNYCMPGLLSNYFKLSCFPYTNKMIFDEDGIAFPLCIAPQDITHMKNTRCIFYYLVKYYLRKNKNKVPAALYLKKTRNFAALFPHLSLYASSEQLIEYRNNMPNDKYRKNFDLIVSLIGNVIILPVESGKTLIKKNIKDYDMFLLVEGTLEIIIKDSLIAKLNPGAIVGEMSLLEKEHFRSADVRALTDVKVMLIPRNLLSKLHKKNPSSAVKLLRILCDNFSDKLDSANKYLMEHIEK